MIRRLFTLLSVLSLLMCVATCVLWVRSRQNEHRYSFVLRGDRYAVTSAAGWLAVNGPPPEASDARVGRAARDAVAGLRDDQVCWVADFADGMGLGPRVYVGSPEPVSDTPADQADSQFTSADIARPLLGALEDRDRFAAAHMLLLRGHTPGGRRPVFPLPSRPAPGTGFLADERCHRGDHHRVPYIEVDHRGLTVTLRRWMDRSRAPTMGKDMDEHPMEGDPDASHFDAVRDAWHRRLDVQAAAVPHWKVAAGTGLLPLLWLGRSVRRSLSRRALRRLGKCPGCGYDLRASPGRCPECGAVPVAGT